MYVESLVQQIQRDVDDLDAYADCYNKIDEFVYKAYGITSEEITLIKDYLEENG